jgi:hypothetical protein
MKNKKANRKVVKKVKTNKPTHEVFQVMEISEGKSYWNRIGAAWLHEDGEGLNVTLNAIPLDGRIIIRTPKSDEN